MEIEVNKKFETHIIEKYENNVVDLNDYPTDDGMTAKQLKEFFDGRTDKEVKASINGIIGAILAPSAAGQIGAEGGTVQEMLDSKVEKEEGMGLSSENFTTELKEKLVNFEPDSKADKVNPKFEGVLELDGGLVTIGLTENGQLLVEKAFVGVTPNSEVELADALYVNGDRVRTEGNTKDVFNANAGITENEKRNAMNNLGISKEVETQRLNINDAELYVNNEGEFVIHNPQKIDENGFLVNPESTLVLGGDFTLNNETLYHSGNLKDLTQPDNVLYDEEKAFFMYNTGLDKTIGDIETALDNIIEMQNTLIGGDA